MLLVIRLIDQVVLSNLLACCVEVVAGLCVYCMVLLLFRDSFIALGINLLHKREKRE